MKLRPAMALVSALLLLSACKPAVPLVDDDAGTSSASSQSSEAISLEGFKRYGIESGLVEYTRDGFQTGKEVLAFDHWGMREAKEEQGKLVIGDVEQTMDRLTIIDGGTIYAIDLKEKYGTKIKNTMLSDLEKEFGTKDFAEMFGPMMEKMGGVKGGTDTIAGKTCDIWTIEGMGTEVCVWNGIPLRTKLTLAGMEVVSTATKVEEGVTFPDSRFEVPEGIEIVEEEPMGEAGGMPSLE